MYEIRYYRQKGVVFDSHIDDDISAYFNAKYGEGNVNTLLLKNGRDIVCKFENHSELTLLDVYNEAIPSYTYISHLLVKMVGGKIQGVVKFRYSEAIETLYIDYLCSSITHQGTGSELLAILKDFVIDYKKIKSLTLTLAFINLKPYYEAQGFRLVDELSRLMKWTPLRGGKKRTKRTKQTKKKERKKRSLKN